MGRVPRPQIAGGVYHATARGNRRHRIYVTEVDCNLFCHLLTSCVRRFAWRCHGLCLMPNHYHLILETPEANLSVGMQRLNGVYAKWFNHAHGFEGHLFERRFRSIVIESEPHLLELARYIALNPVRAGLCRHPGEWKWSSYGAMVGAVPTPEYLTCDWLLSQFGEDRTQAQAAFAAFVDGLPVAA
jgi:REP element-mobilizing transposase RayT